MVSTNRAVIDRFVTSLNERRFDDLVELLDADVIQDWPQSGETFRGRESIRAVLDAFAELPISEATRVVGSEDKWVLTPTWTPLQIVGTGDQYTIEAEIMYPNGDRWRYVGIARFRNGKIHRLTEYFAAPFPPAEWRSRWAEKVAP